MPLLYLEKPLRLQDKISKSFGYEARLMTDYTEHNSLMERNPCAFAPSNVCLFTACIVL